MVLLWCYHSAVIVSTLREQHMMATPQDPSGYYEYSLYQTGSRIRVEEEGWCNACWEFLEESLQHTERRVGLCLSLNKLCPICTSDILSNHLVAIYYNEGVT